MKITVEQFVIWFSVKKEEDRIKRHTLKAKVGEGAYVVQQENDISLD